MKCLIALALLAGAAHADVSKLDKDGVMLQPKATIRERSKLCCGYPIAPGQSSILTFYWLATERAYVDPEPGSIPMSGPAGRIPEHRFVELYTEDGYFFAHVSARFAYALTVEGSGLLLDDRVANVTRRCKFGSGACFEELDPHAYPFGRGNGVRALVPYKSVAVDPHVVPIGEPLYIPEFDGLVLPDGSIHDGCVRADDTGGHIKGHHIDFFVVTYENFKFLLDATEGLGYVSPEVQNPRCEYLRDR